MSMPSIQASAGWMVKGIHGPDCLCGTLADLCPRAEQFFYRRELNLPMHPRLTDKEVEDMVRGVANAAEKVRRCRI